MARPSRWLTCAGLAALAILFWTWEESPPGPTGDLCAVFTQKGRWYRSTRDSMRQFGVPESVQMAILHQESGLRSKARPPRRRILWIFPGPRPSTAYGYGQVLDSTWSDYRERTGRSRARRTRFSDVAHFLGWYGSEIHRLTGIEKHDAYNLYLAYHEGPTGFSRGSYEEKAWLLRTARRVDDRAKRYQQQLTECRARLERPRWWLWLGAPSAVLVGIWILWKWIAWKWSRR